ncbi:sigma factor-like helix-turn-helix DNA-binding protein [Paludifilum halophilum]|uniref:RNA polymerase sigma factor 70 region 4 type 2 domain-containing protein n=1 Tax=Paludifilum halophilum TaxID=1642702 RepID=A0A235B9H2_9BACL|nr:sigma factor-like helix-turn-helix DNA-binding protein [Paludifilum halophilum]OYD08960.1 hypothetical protein CHM34_04070 [Paludifilum halophilum]
MKVLIEEYRQSLEKVRRAKENLPLKGREEERRLLNGMERDLVWTIEWMVTGCQPFRQRGMESRAFYQREVFWSQLSEAAKRKVEWRESLKPEGTSPYDPLLERLLSRLSTSEYEAFVAVRGQCLSFARVASLMNCSKAAVQSYVRRAETKLRRAVAEEGWNSAFSRHSPFQKQEAL